MSELQFINAMSTKHRIAVITDDLMTHANKQHYLAVNQAKERQDIRADNRHSRYLKRATALDAAVMAASVIGIAAVAWFLTAIGAV